jgi:hypothetical protein
MRKRPPPTLMVGGGPGFGKSLLISYLTIFTSLTTPRDMNRSSRSSATPERSFASSLTSDASMELQLLRLRDDRGMPHRTSSFFRFGNITTVNHVPHSFGTTIPSRRQRYRNQFRLASISFLLSIFAFYYAYEALVNPRPLLGRLIFSPSTTVFVVNVLSQSVAFIMAQVFSAIFETLRWSFASRRRGVMLTTFLGLSAGTSPFGVFRLLLASGRHRFWCAQRLKFCICPLMIIDYFF